MAKTATKSVRGEKSGAIRDALRDNPHLSNRHIAELLNSRGIKCSSQDIANLKARIKRMSGKTTFTLEDLKKVKALVAQAGGLKQVQTLLKNVDDLAHEVGGLEKLRRGLQELPDFMSA
jgi:hypothetical protein